jgi:hypothetical protein
MFTDLRRIWLIFRVNEKFKVYAAGQIGSVVIDILRPCLAPDHDQCTGRRVVDLNHDQRCQIAVLIGVWIVEIAEARCWVESELV